MLESNCPRGRHIRPREKDVSLGLMCRTLYREGWRAPDQPEEQELGGDWKRVEAAEQR